MRRQRITVELPSGNRKPPGFWFMVLLCLGVLAASCIGAAADAWRAL